MRTGYRGRYNVYNVKEIEIERDIDAPKGGGKWCDLLRTMELGDSIKVNRTILASINNAARSIGMEVVSRKLDDTKVRVWRTK